MTSCWWCVIVSNIIFMLYFLDPCSLILGLFHRNPNQPLWVTLAYVMSRGCSRISLYLNGSWTYAHALCHCLSRRGKEMSLHAIPFMFFFYTSASYIFLSSLKNIAGVMGFQDFLPCSFHRQSLFIIFHSPYSSPSFCNHPLPLSFRTMVQQEPLKMVSDVRKQRKDTLFTLLGVGITAFKSYF